MVREYKQVEMGVAFKEGYPEAWESDEDYQSGIWLFEDGKPVSLIGTDGGEPEDNWFFRDWSWVVGELNVALNMNAVWTESNEVTKE